jgi:thiol-disulfide isomerase/thioredoxin
VIKAVYVVYANWCPHCVPTAVEPIARAAKELGVPCVLYDIDTADEEKADDLVRKYGDWSEDYLIPQVFVEDANGKMKHALTGDPRGLRYTERAVEALLKSDVFAKPKIAR